MTTNEQLLRKYTLNGDPACFRSLVEEFGGMVYAVCLRITGDPHTSEDLSQDCFLELARKGSTIQTSVAGWLHSTATNRALNLIRSHKQDRKQVSLETTAGPVGIRENFDEVQLLVDEAVDRLDPQLRQIVISHYLEGKTQTEIAQNLGVDQSTVSRRLTQGLDEVRSQLRRLGVLTTVAAVINVLGQSSANAAPPTLTETVAKIGLAGVGWTATKSSTGSLGLFLSTSVATVGNILLYLFCEGWFFFLLLVLEIVVFAFPPKWFRGFLTILCHGQDPWEHPAFPWKRWTWTVPPRDWKQRLLAWGFIGVLFNLVAVSGLLNTPSRWVEPMCMAFAGTLFGLVPAIRLGIRVWFFRANLRLTESEACAFPKRVRTWEMIAFAMTCVIVSFSFLMTGSVIQRPDEKAAWIRRFITWGLPLGSIAFLLYAVRMRFGSPAIGSDLGDNSGGFDLDENPSSKSKVPFPLLMLVLSGAVFFLCNALFSATVARLMLQEPYVRQVPFSIVVNGGFSLSCTLGFLSFLHRMRKQLVPWNFLILLISAMGLAAGGLLAIGYGDYLALTMPSLPGRSPEDLALTAEQLAADVKTRELRKKYGRELAAVAPRLLPTAFKNRDDAPHIFPIVQEAPPLQKDGTTDVWWDGTLTKWIEQMGLPIPPQIHIVKAILVHQYFKVVSHAEKMVLIHTFVCKSSVDAEALARFWGSRAIQKEYLVTVLFEKNAQNPFTTNDQLNLAIRRQLESVDLSNGPPE